MPMLICFCKFVYVCLAVNMLMLLLMLISTTMIIKCVFGGEYVNV